MSGNTSPEGGDRTAAIAFAVGLLTAGSIAIAFFVFLGIRLGFSAIWQEAGLVLGGAEFDMPAPLIEELTALEAVIGNADNPTGAREHDTMLVRGDAELAYVLRPGVSVDAYQVRSVDSMNIDPPVVYVRSSSRLSPALRDWLEQNTRVRYRYNVDADGFRRTVPEVEAKRKILMVGDSGLFGVGVDDDATIASNLQQLVGSDYRVVNAGVAGYDGDAAFRMARKLSDQDDYALLVYVAHNNDFYEPRHISNPDKARGVMANFESLRDRFPEGIVVGMLTFLEYTSEDVLLRQGWRRRERIEAADRLREALPAITRAAGFPFVDWSDIVDEVRQRERTIFAPWSLYVDHAHLSPRATRLFAERIHTLFPEPARPRAEAAGPSAETTAQLEALGYATWVDAKAEDRDKNGVTLWDRERAQPGYNVFVSRHRTRAQLLDMQGAVFHEWGNDALKGDWQYVEMGPSGDLYVLKKASYLARMDWNSRVLWQLSGRFHHDFAIDESGRVFALSRRPMRVSHGDESVRVLEDLIVVASPDGKVLRTHSLYELFEPLVPRELLDRRLSQAAGNRAISRPLDLFHFNTIEVLARAIPGVAEKGDLLVCLRDLDTIAILDAAVTKIKWQWGAGELAQPHHPSLTPDGTILIFDNGRYRDYSRIVELHPAERRIVWQYRADPPSSFHSATRGSAQRLANGNVLIAESNSGHAFEVTRNGTKVWDFLNPDRNPAGARGAI
ncbi:MAG: aryl-sulfate sulfotransferase, partial [Deltaproteobacteria bacterium]|nr:aryl-sulfate sulfotransferase [Deltaproteobacteria bacterium]